AGSMSRHLARGRELLRERLTHRGVSLSTGLLLAVLAEGALSAPVSATLREGTVKAAILFAAGQGAVAGAISSQIIVLTEGVLRAMLLTKLKIAAAVVLGAMAVGLGAGGFWHMAAAAKSPAPEGQNELATEGTAAGVPLPNEVKKKPESREPTAAD